MLCPPLPEPLVSPARTESMRIEPVFLPYAGCGARCVFCGQEAQTGTAAGAVRPHLERAAARLERLADSDQPPRELAFYGGTFTALAEVEFTACLDFLAHWRSRGVIGAARCSTRPGTLGAERLSALVGAGFTMVELGIQTFNDAALTCCGRPYSGAVAREDVARAREAGLSVGVQLLPGMPGVTPERFLQDVDESLALDPAGLRFYPCLVLEGTPLARWWREGRFVPWSLQTAVDALAEATRRAWLAGAPVIRMGLAPEAGLEQAVLAGPGHPALGQMAQAAALHMIIRDWLAEYHGGTLPPGERLALPRRLQGLLFGQHNALEHAYAELKIYPNRIDFMENA